MPKKKNAEEWVPWALRRTNPDIFYFKEDGYIPNSPLPLLIYRGVFDSDYECCEDWLIKKFESNKWTNSRTEGIYDYNHFHSNTHKVLGVCNGEATLQLGGSFGITTVIEKGDVIVIPAGVAYRCVSHSDDFKVVGGYPDGRIPDLLKGEEGDRPCADENISKLALPDIDPILGPDEGLLKIWNVVKSQK